MLALDFPRPDFNAAVAEMLIALLSTFDPPDDERDWAARWRERRINAGALAVAAQAFELERFAQEPGIEGTALAIENLLIDALAGKEADDARDLMNRAGRIKALSPAMAARSALVAAELCTAGRLGAETGTPPSNRVVSAITPRCGVAGRSPRSCRRARTSGVSLWPNVETREQLATRAVGRAPSDPLTALPWMRSSSGHHHAGRRASLHGLLGHPAAHPPRDHGRPQRHLQPDGRCEREAGAILRSRGWRTPI